MDRDIIIAVVGAGVLLVGAIGYMSGRLHEQVIARKGNAQFRTTFDNALKAKIGGGS